MDRMFVPQLKFRIRAGYYLIQAPVFTLLRLTDLRIIVHN